MFSNFQRLHQFEFPPEIERFRQVRRQETITRYIQLFRIDVVAVDTEEIFMPASAHALSHVPRAHPTSSTLPIGILFDNTVIVFAAE